MDKVTAELKQVCDSCPEDNAVVLVNSPSLVAEAEQLLKGKNVKVRFVEKQDVLALWRNKAN